MSFFLELLGSFLFLTYSFHFISAMWVFHSHAGHLGGGTNASGVEQYVFVTISGTPEARGEISAMWTKGTGKKIAHKWRPEALGL